MSDTTISVPDELADELYSRKNRGESYADVIWRLIEQAETGDTEPPQTRETPSDERRDSMPQEDPADRGLSALVDDVANDTLPGSGEKLEARREALHAVVEYLKEHGSAKPADFRENVYPEHTAEYTEATDPARSWWKNCIYKGLGELANRTDEIEKADTSGEWRYVGDD